MKKQQKRKLIKGKEPTLDLGNGLIATLMHDFDRYENGSMAMRVADCDIEVKQGDKIIGNVGTALGGLMYVIVGHRMWKLNCMKLFELVVDAEKKQYADRGENHDTRSIRPNQACQRTQAR